MRNRCLLAIRSAVIGLLLSASASPVFGETVIPKRDQLQSALLWGLLPGAGHYYLGEAGTGTAYAATVLPLIGAGIWLDERNNELDRDDEVNTFWLLAIKEWELSLFTTYRSALRADNRDLRAMGVDDTSVGELFLSPFRQEQYSSPMVILAGLLGIAVAAYDSRNSENTLTDISRIGILGVDANREWGSTFYGVDAFGLSLASGVSEESIWRGLIQNEMELTFGRQWGLWSTATLFGAAHLVDLDGELRGERVVVATLAGLCLGYMYQRNDHRLSKPIAAHFWYNLTAMMTAFALDPENNPLGVQVSFGF